MNSTIHANSPSTDFYDPDEVIPRGSPLLQARPLSDPALKLRPAGATPRPPLFDVKRSSSRGHRKRGRRRHHREVLPTQGDAVLITFMGDGRNQMIASVAGSETLPISDLSEESNSRTTGSDSDSDSSSGSTGSWDEDPLEARERAAAHETIHGGAEMSVDPSPAPQPAQNDGAHGIAKEAVARIVNVRDQAHEVNGTKAPEDDMLIDLSPPAEVREAPKESAKTPERATEANRSTPDNGMAGLAAMSSLALQALHKIASPEVSAEENRTDAPRHEPQNYREKGQTLEPVRTQREIPFRDDRSVYGLPPFSATNSASSLLSPRTQASHPSPMGLGSAGLVSPLPPIAPMGSPRSEANGNSLPSIREQLGEIADGRHSQPYPYSPQGSAPAPMMPLGQARSPPISPNNMYRHPEMASPGHALPPSPYYQSVNGSLNGYSSARDYQSSSNTNTPSTNDTVSTPATSTSIADQHGNQRISIDGLTQHAGSFVCKVPGCTAQPFQTQYLLNSHNNVHSSERPHYCPVPGCPRSEGGKGFKRKNEMIRHGLVHDSPGYVCPFCPDREHKYPRPDNLQRYTAPEEVAKPMNTC